MFILFKSYYAGFLSWFGVHRFQEAAAPSVSYDYIFNLFGQTLPLPEMEFKEFEPRFKSAKPRFELSAGLNLETFDTILSGTNHI